MAYTEQNYAHCVQSKFNTNQYFIYKKDGDVGIGTYTDLSAAQIAAQNYDKEYTYLIPTTDTSDNRSTFFVFKDYQNNEISLANKVGQIINKTVLPKASTITEQTENTVNAVYDIYQKTKTIIITKPDSYTESELTTIINSMNRVFNILLPRKAGSYTYDKNIGAWKEMTAV